MKIPHFAGRKFPTPEPYSREWGKMRWEWVFAGLSGTVRSVPRTRRAHPCEDQMRKDGPPANLHTVSAARYIRCYSALPVESALHA